MTQALTIIKIIGAWGCIAAAVVLFIITKETNLIVPLGIVSIAFSQAPIG